MDYSLLVGIHYHKLKNGRGGESKDSSTGQRDRASSDVMAPAADVSPTQEMINEALKSNVDLPMSLPCSPRGPLPPGAPILLDAGTLQKIAQAKKEDKEEPSDKKTKKSSHQKSKGSDGSKPVERPPTKHKQNSSDLGLVRRKTAVPLSSSPVAAATTTTTTTTAAAGGIRGRKMPKTHASAKYSLSALAAAGALAEANAATGETTPKTHTRRKALEEIEQQRDDDDDDDGVDDDGMELPEGVATGGDEQEFLTMKMNLQPHTSQVEQCFVDGIGDVDVVTMPFNDYSLQVRDTRLDYGTPQLHYNNLWYRDNGGMYSGINGISYFFGIIDILMVYTPKKSLERTYKTLRYRGQGEVSSCPPNRYAVRFLSFVNAGTL